jgi:excisionase family DNA binding protein
MTVQEVANALGVKRSTVKELLKRAYRKIRKEVG